MTATAARGRPCFPFHFQGAVNSKNISDKSETDVPGTALWCRQEVSFFANMLQKQHKAQLY